jgi:hypothetical protein
MRLAAEGADTVGDILARCKNVVDRNIPLHIKLTNSPALFIYLVQLESRNLFVSSPLLCVVFC